MSSLIKICAKASPRVSILILQTDKLLDFGNQCLLKYCLMKDPLLLFQVIFNLKKCSHWNKRSSKLEIYKAAHGHALTWSSF